MNYSGRLNFLEEDSLKRDIGIQRVNHLEFLRRVPTNLIHL